MPCGVRDTTVLVWIMMGLRAGESGGSLSKPS